MLEFTTVKEHPRELDGTDYFLSKGPTTGRISKARKFIVNVSRKRNFEAPTIDPTVEQFLNLKITGYRSEYISLHGATIGELLTPIIKRANQTDMLIKISAKIQRSH